MPKTTRPKMRTTVLEGYYRSGDHECFCFDTHDGPEAHREARFSEAGLTPYDADNDFDAEMKVYATFDDCRVYPDDFLPEGHYGRWTITVAFEPMDEPAPANQPAQ